MTSTTVATKIRKAAMFTVGSLCALALVAGGHLLQQTPWAQSNGFVGAVACLLIMGVLGGAILWGALRLERFVDAFSARSRMAERGLMHLPAASSVDEDDPTR